MCECYNRNSTLMRSVITRLQCSVMYWLLQLRQELVLFSRILELVRILGYHYMVLYKCSSQLW